MSQRPTASAGEALLTIRDAIAKTAEYLSAKGINTARLDAELLIGEAVGLNRLGLYLNFDRPLNPDERERARELLRRRAHYEPVAYILGHREFHSREFAVDRRVLIPRPETELLVDRAIEELNRRFPDAGGAFSILELGIGSGAIAVSLAAELPDARITATEISEGAADVARANARRHNVSDRIDIRLQSDFAGLEGPFHAIVSNPPYISPSDRNSLPPDVRDFEPAEALFAEEEGLAAYRFLTAEAPRLLLPDGFLLVEIGQGQVPAVTRLAEAHGLRVEAVMKDYAGIERVMLMGR